MWGEPLSHSTDDIHLWLPYSVKLSREKTSRISQFCGDLRNLGAWHPSAWKKRAIRESFLRENRIFHQSAKVFSLESFPLYSITLSWEIKLLIRTTSPTHNNGVAPSVLQYETTLSPISESSVDPAMSPWVDGRGSWPVQRLNDVTCRCKFGLPVE